VRVGHQADGIVRTLFFTEYAERDLDEIFDFLCRRRSVSQAERVLLEIERIADSLIETPNRGRYPPELLEIGVRSCREVFSHPYRIVYRASEQAIYVLLIADGRRNLRTLLEQRVLFA